MWKTEIELYELQFTAFHPRVQEGVRESRKSVQVEQTLKSLPLNPLCHCQREGSNLRTDLICHHPLGPAGPSTWHTWWEGHWSFSSAAWASSPLSAPRKARRTQQLALRLGWWYWSVRRRLLFSLIILVQCGTSGLGPAAERFPCAAQPPCHHWPREEKDGDQGELKNSEILSKRGQINDTSKS